MLLRVRFDCPWSNSSHSMNGISRYASTLDQYSCSDRAGAPYSSPAMNQEAFAGIQALMNFLAATRTLVGQGYHLSICPNFRGRRCSRGGRRPFNSPGWVWPC